MTFVPSSNLARRCFALICISYLLFIGIASFYLTNSTLPLSGEVMDKLLNRTLESLRPNLHNLRDIATNILLYLPLGAGIAAWIACGRPIRYLTPVLLIGFVVSTSVEIIQAFIGRFSDPADVVSNSAGFAIGYLMMAAAVRVFHLRPAALLGMDLDDSQAGKVSTLSAVRFLYVGIFYFVQLLPLNISVGLSDIYRKLRPEEPAGEPRIILDPFYHWRDDDIDAHRLLLRMLAYTPLAALSSAILVLHGRPSVLVPVLHCLLLAVIAEASKIFILNGRSDVITLPLAACAGFATAWCIWRWSTSLHPQKLGHRQFEHFQVVALGMITYALFLALLAWSPYQFEIQAAAIKQKLIEESNWLPLRLHFSNRSIQAAVDLVREFCIFLPLGGLTSAFLTQWFKRQQRVSLLLISAAFCFGYAFFLELSQLIVVNRTVDITDPLLASLGGASGSLLAPLLYAPFATVQSVSQEAGQD